MERRSGRSSAGAPTQQSATAMAMKPKADCFILGAGQTDSANADIWQLLGYLHRPAHTDLNGSFLQQEEWDKAGQEAASLLCKTDSFSWLWERFPASAAV